ncbi:MAG: hypothetical protein PHX43_05720, partial [Alphaproteobacteria bacterium]|nr:hypothetical protein [Alphaproteobacteria bacterium]
MSYSFCTSTFRVAVCVGLLPMFLCCLSAPVRAENSSAVETYIEDALPGYGEVPNGPLKAGDVTLKKASNYSKNSLSAKKLQRKPAP